MARRNISFEHKCLKGGVVRGRTCELVGSLPLLFFFLFFSPFLGSSKPHHCQFACVGSKSGNEWGFWTNTDLKIWNSARVFYVGHDQSLQLNLLIATDFLKIWSSKFNWNHCKRKTFSWNVAIYIWTLQPAKEIYIHASLIGHHWDFL